MNLSSHGDFRAVETKDNGALVLLAILSEGDSTIC